MISYWFLCPFNSSESKRERKREDEKRGGVEARKENGSSRARNQHARIYRLYRVSRAWLARINIPRRTMAHEMRHELGVGCAGKVGKRVCRELHCGSTNRGTIVTRASSALRRTSAIQGRFYGDNFTRVSTNGSYTAANRIHTHVENGQSLYLDIRQQQAFYVIKIFLRSLL